ncbi:MAG: PepSY domain-containing protein [Caldisericaceae bacterium]|nr:PepSY domain-containing protein [Caldisericaceae bacterium]
MKIDVKRSIVFLLVFALFAGMVSGCAPKTKPGENAQNGSQNQNSGISQEKQSPEESKALTAREAYKHAVKKAKSLAGDAEFVKIDNFSLGYGEKGVSEVWIAEFVSKSRSRLYQIRVIVDKGVHTSLFSKEEIASQHPVAIKGSWIDSDKAFDIALNHVKDKSFKSFWMGLSRGRDGVTAWSVRFRYKKGEPFWVELDATNGSIIKTWSGY